MNERAGGPPPGVLWSLPVRIERDGTWTHAGAEIDHPEVLAALRAGLRRDAEGRYSVEVEGRRAGIEVVDVPFVVRGVRPAPAGPPGRARFRVLLNDGTEEDLDLSTIRVAPGEVIYCAVKGGRFEARLSPECCVALGLHCEYDEGADALTLPDGTRRVVPRG
jgi:hypothetical protein